MVASPFQPIKPSCSWYYNRNIIFRTNFFITSSWRLSFALLRLLHIHLNCFMITNISLSLSSHFDCGFRYFLMQRDTEPLGISFLFFCPPSHIFRWYCYCRWWGWPWICLRKVFRRSLLITEVLRIDGPRCFSWEFCILFFIQSSNSCPCLSYKIKFGPTMHGRQLIERTGSKSSFSKRFLGATLTIIWLQVHDKYFCCPFNEWAWCFRHQGILPCNWLEQ